MSSLRTIEALKKSAKWFCVRLYIKQTTEVVAFYLFSIKETQLLTELDTERN